MVPTSTGWPRLRQSTMTVGDLVELLGRGAEDRVVVVLADDRDVGRDGDDLEAVDVAEFLGLGRGRAGHAGELLVEAEIVLEGDRGQRLVLGLDLDVFLGLQRLVQALGIAAARHHAAGELVDDHHFVVADDVVLVLAEHLVGAERRVEVVHDRDVLDVVEDVALVGIALEQTGREQMLLELFDALVGEGHGALLLVVLEVALADDRDDLVDLLVERRAVLGRAGDDQRRARLVDEDRVHFVDDGVGVAALHHLGARVLHVVAQVVEAELVVGAVGDVGGVGRPCARRRSGRGR